MYLSFLMGANDISDRDLTDLKIQIVESTGSENRKLYIPNDRIAEYATLLKEKLTPGFWTEFLNESEIFFLFKFENGTVQELVLSPNNEHEISVLCALFANESPDKTANVYKFISENNFYHEYMIKNYSNMIERSRV